MSLEMKFDNSINLLLVGYLSVQTTEKYLSCKQRFRHAVNDRLG